MGPLDDFSAFRIQFWETSREHLGTPCGENGVLLMFHGASSKLVEKALGRLGSRHPVLGHLGTFWVVFRNVSGCVFGGFVYSCLI